MSNQIEIYLSHTIENSTLNLQCPIEQLQSHTGKLLAAFVNGLSDRNAAVRKIFAAAIGQLLRTAKDSSLEKLFAKLRAWYLESDDRNFAVAYTYRAISRHNPDKIRSHAAQALPLVFLAMSEDNDVVTEIWEEVWSDCTPGSSEAGV